MSDANGRGMLRGCVRANRERKEAMVCASECERAGASNASILGNVESVGEEQPISWDGRGLEMTTG